MGNREIDPRLKELYDSGQTVYSISRLDTINGCLCEAYKTYVLHQRSRDNVYSSLGTKTHDTLEAIVNGTATEADLLPAIYDELENLDMLGIEFPKGRDGSDSIRAGWVTDMEHFATTYKSPRGNNLKTEELFLYKTDDGDWLQGYIDLQRVRADGSIDIFDYKTSSLYSKSDIKEHGRQLVLYGMAKEQEGYEISSVNWIFLKYVEIEFMGRKTSKSKNKTLITKVVERKKIASELSKYVAADMSELGYDVLDIELALNEFEQTNKFSSLPNDVAKLYTMKPYVCKYEYTDENIEECKAYIKETIDFWNSLDKSDEDIFVPRQFTKMQKNGKIVSDIFYCTMLCGHFDSCKYIHDYLDTMQSEDEDDDIFG